MSWKPHAFQNLNKILETWKQSVETNTIAHNCYKILISMYENVYGTISTLMAWVKKKRFDSREEAENVYEKRESFKENGIKKTLLIYIKNRTEISSTKYKERRLTEFSNHRVFCN